MFNNTQIQTTGTALIAGMAGFLAGRGVFGFDQATWITILGAVGGLVVSVYTAILTRKTNLVTEVANLPEVDKVVVNEKASEQMVANTPVNVVAS